MKDTKQLELTIRTASLIKSLSNLVGTTDAKLARMMWIECIPQFTALGEFIDKCNGLGNGTDKVKP